MPPEASRTGPEQAPESASQKVTVRKQADNSYAVELYGKQYEISADLDVFLLQGEQREAVDPEDHSTGLQAVLRAIAGKQAKAERVNTRRRGSNERNVVERNVWSKGRENNVAYSEITLSSGTYRIVEKGRVYRKQGESWEYVSADADLPQVVERRLTVVAERWGIRERAKRVGRSEKEVLRDQYHSADLLLNLQLLEVNAGGRQLSIEGLPSSVDAMFSRLGKLNIRPDRYPQFYRNMKRMAYYMGDALGRVQNPPWEGKVTWNAQLNRLECTSTNQDKWTGQRIVATPVEAFHQYANMTSVRGYEPEQLLSIPRRPGEKQVRVTRNERSDRSSASYTTYTRQEPHERTDFLAPDGTLRYRNEKGATLVYNDQSNRRPSMVHVGDYNGVELDIPSSSALDAPVVRTRFEGGKSMLDIRGGEPIGNYQHFSRLVESGAISVRPGQDPREAYADHITTRLKTPEAIMGFLTSYLDFTGRGAVGVAEYRSEYGTQNVQHALVTLETGRGDCEDFAIAADYLLTRAGFPAIAMRKESNHFICTYFEERYVSINGQLERRFDVVMCDTAGLRRSTSVRSDGFKSPQEALDFLTQKMEGKGLGPMLKKLNNDPSQRENYNTVLAINQAGGGVETISAADLPPPGTSIVGRANSGVLAFNSNLERYVRRAS